MGNELTVRLATEKLADATRIPKEIIQGVGNDVWNQIDLKPRSDRWKLASGYFLGSGAIVGDVCGSIYEFNNHKTDEPEKIDLFNKNCTFTDDTVLTSAVAWYISQAEDRGAEHRFQSNGDRIRLYETFQGYSQCLWEWGNRYPGRGYGSKFRQWLSDFKRKPYGSYGNGAAMRISPVAQMFFGTARWQLDWAYSHRRDPNTVIHTSISYGNGFDSLLAEIACATLPTHNHVDAINGAQAVVMTMLLAWLGWSKEDIRQQISSAYGACFKYDLSQTLSDIRPMYTFDETCMGTVPVAIIAFLESHDFVSAIQNAISVGGDSDTIAAITGSIAETYYHEIPSNLCWFVSQRLPNGLNCRV